MVRKLATDWRDLRKAALHRRDLRKPAPHTESLVLPEANRRVSRKAATSWRNLRKPLPPSPGTESSMGRATNLFDRSTKKASRAALAVQRPTRACSRALVSSLEYLGYLVARGRSRRMPRRASRSPARYLILRPYADSSESSYSAVVINISTCWKVS